jgi:hypothetical protein
VDWASIPVTAPSRREFLVAAATAAIGGVFVTPATAAAKPVSNLTAADLHYHVLPPVPLPSNDQRFERRGSLPVEPWSPQRAIAAMDTAGVHTTVLSMPTNPLLFGAADYRRFVRACNEYAARLVREYPGRLGFFASVPLPDVDGALDEIRYAYDVLHADGILLATSYGVRWIGDPTFTPILREIDRRAALASVHPPGTNCCRTLSRYLPYGDEVAGETDAALTSLRANATLRELIQIRYLVSHRVGGPGPFSSAQL